MFPLLFKYPASEFQFGELIYLRDWPLWLWLALWLVGAVLLLWLVWRRRLLSPARTLTLSALQLAMWSLVLWVVWQPALVIKSLRTGDNHLAVMLDTSASMSVADPAQTRMQQAQTTLADPVFTTLARDYPLRRYVFATDAGKVDHFDALPAPGNATRIAPALLQVLNASRTTPLGAVILLSDGSDNLGQLDPEQLAAIRRFGVPVHVIGIGREQMPEDLELDSVLVPTQALPGSRLSARLSVRHDPATNQTSAGPQTARIKVTDGQRLLAVRDVTLARDSTLTPAWLEFDVRDTGYRDLSFTVVSTDNERELRNNTRTQLVNVASEVANVLYVEGEPRWEYKFLRRATDDDQSLRVVSMLRTTTNGLYRQGVVGPEELKDGFPRSREELFKYDALIIGNVQAAYFTKVQQQLINEFVNIRGGSLLMLGGSKTLGEGGWANTVVNDLLPARIAEVNEGRGSFHRVFAPVQVTTRGQREAWLRFSDDASDNAKQWQSLPQLADYQQLGALKPAAASLLSIKVQNREWPLLVTQAYGRGHVTLLASGGTWRWQMGLPSTDLRHESFWRQLLRHQVTGVPRQNELSASVEGDQIRVRAILRDRAFQPQRDGQPSVIVTLPSGYNDKLLLSPVSDQPGVYEARFAPQGSGTFFMDLPLTKGAAAPASERTAVHYQAGAAEYFSLRQNRALLTQLASSTGGRYWSVNDLSGLPEAIRFSPAGITEQLTKPLWDMPVVFVLLLLLKACEWLLRRRWGVI